MPSLPSLFRLFGGFSVRFRRYSSSSTDFLAQMSSAGTRVYSEEMPGKFGRPPAP
eukprot:CAMPEP_0181522096 /NCGR_PEP_ID=MMETSP1110-20121109/67191_1 /TAXON_ID=174948 /ORGANISM="Symbiodinium sp., Strain CCMP421" /LENGTH=54 /DNA_ID=CAMNT_0023652689 /DNA_START=71 /DNA_END=231 /DNA_ORIENTATION=+